MPYTGLVGRPNGQIVPLVNTMKRSKEIDISAYISAYTGYPAYTVQLGRAVFQADSNGLWRMDFTIFGTISAVIQAAMEIQIAGVTFYGSIQQIVALKVSPVVSGSASAFARASTGRISCDHFSGTVNAYGFSGGVLLASEPTWASLGTTWVAVAESPGDVTAYIPNADASTVGLVSIANQTFGGRKSAGNSKVRASVSASTTGITPNTPTEIVFNNDSLSGVNCDTNNEFNTSNGRFTATRAGWYSVSASVQLSGINIGKYWGLNLYKNGSAGFRFSPAMLWASLISDYALTATGMVYLNGTTDYISAFIQHNDTGSANLYGNSGGDSSHIVIIELV